MHIRHCSYQNVIDNQLKDIPEINSPGITTSDRFTENRLRVCSTDNNNIRTGIFLRKLNFLKKKISVYIELQYCHIIFIIIYCYVKY